MTPTIKGKGFILRPMSKSDIDNLARNANDRIIAKNVARMPYPYTKSDALTWVKKRLADQKKKNPKTIGFVIEVDDEAAGHIAFTPEGHKAVVGYWLGRKYWGKGIVSEALKLVTNYAMKKAGIVRMFAHVFSWNIASMRVLEKAGYKREGLLKKNFKKGNKFLDAYIFAKVK